MSEETTKELIYITYKPTRIQVCTCGKCGREIDKNDLFCRYCGVKLVGFRYDK